MSYWLIGLKSGENWREVMARVGGSADCGPHPYPSSVYSLRPGQPTYDRKLRNGRDLTAFYVVDEPFAQAASDLRIELRKLEQLEKPSFSDLELVTVLNLPERYWPEVLPPSHTARS